MTQESGKMTKRTVLLLAVGACLLVGSPLQADLKKGDTLTANWPIHLAGGPFAISPFAPSTFSPFNSFCAEIGHDIFPTLPYEVTDVATSNGLGKSVSGYTEWLYTNYRGGTLTQYDDSDNDRNALQYGIWLSLGYTDADLTGTLASGKSTYETKTAWQSHASDLVRGNVLIARLELATNDYADSLGLYEGDPAQDILVQATVPAPGAALLASLGLGLVGWFRRRLG
jgi:hypothetical protein